MEMTLLQKRLKEQNKKKTYARVEYVKEDKKKEKCTIFSTFIVFL